MREAVSKHDELEEEVRETMASTEEEGSSLEQEGAEVATEETEDVQPPYELDEAVIAVSQIRAEVNKLDAKSLELKVLDGLSAEVRKLRDFAAASLIAHFDETSAKFAPTITALGAETAIAAQRTRLAEPGVISGDVEAWLGVLAERLEAIAGLDGELEGLQPQIDQAAADNDLAAVERHTTAVQERTGARAQEVSALVRHIVESRAGESGAEASEETTEAGEEDEAKSSAD